MTRKTLRLVLVIFALTCNCFALDGFTESGWKNIKPLKTDRKTAEKVWGTPKKVTESGYFNYEYETDGFLAQVNYSNQPCEKSTYDRGDYKVRSETVISYKIMFHELTKLEDLEFQRKKYRREEDPEIIGTAYYIYKDENNAIIIGVGTMDKVEYVGDIRFYPSLADKKKLGCQYLKAAADKTIERANTIKSLKNTSKIKFSSVQTKLDSENCQPLSKPTSDNYEVPYLCNGYKDYKIYVGTRGRGVFYVGREITKDVNSWINLELPSFLLGLDEDITVEWRLANGEPFACIVRVRYDLKTVNPNEEGRANEIFVKNLRGFAPINFKVDTYYNYDAADEAKIRADADYRKLK